MADTALQRWPDGRFAPPSAKWIWNYELGTLLEGMDSAWLDTADGRYFEYIKRAVDQFVTPEGEIPTRDVEEYQLDHILLGRQLLLLYRVTLEQRYAHAATRLYEQLLHQPRTRSGGFWHKQRYPNQMWLDGLYMAEPFYAEYASIFHHPDAYRDIAKQFALIQEHARDPKTGLLYHGWDESKSERWASKETGLSGEFWGRAMGWYMMALVDTIEYLPEDDPARAELLKYLVLDADAVVRYQDEQSGLWFQVIDKAGAPGNYLESSASCMFVYALAKSVRRSYLPSRYLESAERGYKGILNHFIKDSPDGSVSLTQTVLGAGLGGAPYRDGSYSYYVGEKVGADDPKGVGAFLLASAEMEQASQLKVGRGKTVLLDAWFNSQMRPDATGRAISFHYKWDDMSDSGYSMFGQIFRNFGAETTTLYTRPVAADLRKAQVYIIVSPDIPSRNPNPHYMETADADEIALWVKSGGVLMMMENDPEHADIDHLNLLAEKFGIHFNKVLRNTVEGRKFEQGKIDLEPGGPIFHRHYTAYMKEICTITAQSPAKAILRDKGDVLIATSKFGKGSVVAVVDPWVYNEYTDGRKLPPEYENYAAGRDLAEWALEQASTAR